MLLIYLLFDIVFASFKLPFVFDRIKDTFCQYLCTNLGTNGFNAASFVTICFCEMRKSECQLKTHEIFKLITNRNILYDQIKYVGMNRL